MPRYNAFYDTPQNSYTTLRIANMPDCSHIIPHITTVTHPRNAGGVVLRRRRALGPVGPGL